MGWEGRLMTVEKLSLNTAIIGAQEGTRTPTKLLAST